MTLLNGFKYRVCFSLLSAYHKDIFDWYADNLQFTISIVRLFPHDFTSLHASLVAQMVKHLLVMCETQVPSLGWEDPLEKGMAAYSNILAWRIPWKEESRGLQSMESQRVGCDWATNTFTLLVSSKAFLLPSPTLLLFSRSVVSDSLWPHGRQHARLPCPLLSPGVCSKSCPLSQQAIQPSHPLLPPHSSCSHQHLFQHQGLFPDLHITPHQMVKVLELWHQSFQWIFKIDFL